MNGVKRSSLLGLAVMHGRRFLDRGLVGLGLFGVVVGAGSVHAQSRTGLVGQGCVSPDLVRQIQIAGGAVFVEPGGEERKTSQAGRGSSGNITAGSDQSRAKAYEAFEKNARRGDPAAEVNLAVAILAGWNAAAEAQPASAGAPLYWLSEAAWQGYALAYFDLGVLYQNGCGVQQDYAEAARYFRKGADANHAASQMNLGYLYDQGWGVERDRGQAAAWYRRAAEQGLAGAQFNLGDLYAQEGTSRDESEALVWFHRAAAQGHTMAQLMLGAMYAQGRGTPRNLSMAYQWLTAARLAGDIWAEGQLRAVEAHLSAREIAEAKAQAVRLLQSTPVKTPVAVLR
jgi:TPR repeat protein